MVKKTKIAQAIAMGVTGTALLSCGISTATAEVVAYNGYRAHAGYLATDGGANQPDGFVWGYQNNGGNQNAGNLVSDPAAASITTWVGTGGANTTPFGYKGSSHLNWAITLESAGDSAMVSQQHAFDTYGVYADIDTAGGAWVDTAKPQGWRHNTEIGLLKSDVTQNVHLNPSTILSEFGNFGVTVFEGMDTSTGSYSHHGTWNNSDASNPPIFPIVYPIGMSNPFLTSGLDIVVGWDDTVGGATGDFTFLAEAGMIYSIYLGGSGGTGWGEQHDGYVLDVTTSPVPVPAAVWLMGSAMVGLARFRRKKAAV